MTRRSTKKYDIEHRKKEKNTISYFQRRLKKLEEEIHRKQEIQENKEDGDDD